MTNEPVSNDYLNQVVQEQAQIEQELRRKVPALAAPQAAAVPHRLDRGMVEFQKGLKGVEDSAEPANGSWAHSGTPNYRITGFWRWQTVVVTPNAHVIHT